MNGRFSLNQCLLFLHQHVIRYFMKWFYFSIFFTEKVHKRHVATCFFPYLLPKTIISISIQKLYIAPFFYVPDRMEGEGVLKMLSSSMTNINFGNEFPIHNIFGEADCISGKLKYFMKGPTLHRFHTFSLLIDKAI